MGDDDASLTLYGGSKKDGRARGSANGLTEKRFEPERPRRASATACGASAQPADRGGQGL